MSAAEGNGNISYSVKELLAKQDGKLDTIILTLGSKADKSDLDDLTKRLVSLEQQVGLQDKLNEALRTKASDLAAQSATNLTRREKIMGVLLAMFALAVQIYAQFGG